MQAFWQRWRAPIIILTVVSVLICVIWWFLFGFWADMTWRQWQWFTQSWLERGFFPGLSPMHWTKWTFMFLAVFFGFASWTSWELLKPRRSEASPRRYSDVHYGYREQPDASSAEQTINWRSRQAGVFAICVIFFVLCFGRFVGLIAMNVNDFSAAYAEGTEFVIENEQQPPSSLSRLVRDTTAGKNGCALYAHNDMPGCINVGTYDFEWESRGASATGAEIVLRRSSSAVQNTTLLGDTLTYIYRKDGTNAWSAIRDGTSTQPLYGVVEYTGSGNVKNCRFEGPNKINKAFGGRWNNNLSDIIAKEFRTLHYSSSDRYGYCDGTKPVIVIPVKKQTTFRTRIAFRAAGVLIITGSPSGAPQFKYVEDVNPGDVPGPVYPASLAEDQRRSMHYLAGIRDNWFGKFGYTPTEVETQEGNPSEYQLRDKKTGRVYWVTPLKARRTDSQTLTAYSVIPADETTSGTLNKMRVFVLPDEDPRIINLDDLIARTKQAITNDPRSSTFFTAGGTLVEFLPLGNSQWQVYAEINGRVAYRIIVPSDARISPTIDYLDEQGLQPSPPSTPPAPTQPGSPSNTGSSCRADLSNLNDQDLAQCLSDIADELKKRRQPTP